MEIVKTRTTKYVINNISAPFIKFGVYRKIREKHGQKVQRTCFRCNRKFTDVEEMGLAPTSKGNKLLCMPCVKDAGESGVKVHWRDKKKGE